MTKIRELRIERGIQQKDLAAALGIPANTFNQWETGKREPDFQNLSRIADYFDVSVDYLLGEYIDSEGISIARKRVHVLSANPDIQYDKVEAAFGTSIATLKAWSNGYGDFFNDKLDKLADFFGVSIDYLLGREEKKPPEGDVTKIYRGLFRPEMRKVPILGKTACGEPIYSPDFDDGYALLNSDIAADFALEAKGDSMTGIGINSGDIIFFVEQNMVDNGQLAAVFVGEEVTLKRVYYYPDKNKLVLNSENPEFEPLVYIGEELDGIRIIGRAVAQLRKIK